MNILIESGATKSTCIGFEGTCIFFTHKTTGINATYATKEEIVAIFQDIIAKNSIDVAKIANIRYYGAGCFHNIHAEKVKNVLHHLFPNANINVLSDLYAACHALCNHKRGFAGILGTGAASCFYDGVQIVNKAPSLGWLLGDEGSGVHLGKLFVKEYLTNKMDPEIALDFEKTFAVNSSDVFEKVYQSSNPRTFFASVPVFLQKHPDNKKIRTLIEKSFQDFFNQQIDYYSEFRHPWFFCGSIAFHFQDILLAVAQRNNVNIERIIQECAQELLFQVP